jgi:microcystin-dependent protein
MATAIPFTVPNEFSNGTAIVASQHNANWDYVENYCEQLSDGSNIAADAIVTASIIDNAVTAAKIATGTITATQLASNAVTTVKITDANVTLAKLATAVQNLLVPAGTIVATISATADTGWILLDGTPVVNAQSLYTALWAVAPTSWKSGSTLLIPNMANKMLEGVGTTARGAEGGSNTVTIAETNLPSHQHTVNPPNTSVSVTVNDNTVDRVTRLTAEVANGFATGISPGSTGTGLLAGTAGFGLSNTTFGMSVAHETEHTHTASGSVDIAEFNSGPVGSGTALNVTNAHLAVNFQIKAH